jgi:hypothetical protein
MASCSDVYALAETEFTALDINGDGFINLGDYD